VSGGPEGLTVPARQQRLAVGNAAAPPVAVGNVEAPVALYVHVPFCISICPYCDFVVYAGAAARGPSNRIDAFLAALETEIDLRADALDAIFGRPSAPGLSGVVSPGTRPPLDTLYIGGGTPSLLPAEAIARLVELVRRRFGLAGNAEVTLEANPGPDERGDAAALVRAGIGRLSIGAQSLDRAELRRLGRRHRPEDVGETVAAARDAGIGSVSLDLLYDVPGGSLETWAATLDAALALAPDHLSLYALTLDDPDAEGLTGPAGDHLPTTSGARRWRATARHDQDEDLAATEYQFAVDRLASSGWRGYEISNWARPGHESRHNLAYWLRLPYEAVGPGAHAFDGVTRRWNAARLDTYVAGLRPADGGRPSLPPGGAETLDTATATAESLILGLRTDRGVPLAARDEAPLATAFDWALDAGLLATTDDRIVLTTRGRLLSNELFSRLI
jgi:oxygen-independent coproporphyrinogen III oxidase